MAVETVAWPRKTREMRTQHLDSTIWNDFRFRDDDIIISTYAKSGTTWMQQFEFHELRPTEGQLLEDGAPLPPTSHSSRRLAVRA